MEVIEEIELVKKLPFFAKIKDKVYFKYASDVLKGRIIACDYVKLACKRFFKDLSNDKYRFNFEKVTRLCKFVYSMKHFKGMGAGTNFKLEPFQAFIVANLYGFEKKELNENSGEMVWVRKYRNAYLEMSRKQGKSSLVAALALIGLIADGEASPEIVCAANSREQAKILFDAASGYAHSLDPKQKTLQTYRNTINYKKDGGFIKCLAADASKLDGLNCHIGIIDEYHEAKTSAVRDVIESSMGSRLQPMMIIITTAGFNLDGVCYAERDKNIKVLYGDLEEESTFAMIFTLDDGDDYTDPKVWRKSNPNLGVSCTTAKLKEAVQKAKNMPEKEVEVKTKHFNIWCHSDQTWLPESIIDKSMKNEDETLYHFNLEEWRDQYVTLGIDLASTNDLCALTICGFDDVSNTYHTKSYAFLPEGSVEKSPLRDFWKKMHRTGYLSLTEGNVVDYEYIKNLIIELRDVYGVVIQDIYLDKYNATSFSLSLIDEGLPVQFFSQTIVSFSPVTKELERLMYLGQIKQDANPLLMFCYRCVSLIKDSNENIKPSKVSYEKQKIDLVISTIQALAAQLNNRGLLTGVFTVEPK